MKKIFQTFIFGFLIVLVSTPSSQAVPLSDVCGNGILEGSESCDDGNMINGDGCSASCGVEASCPNEVLLDFNNLDTGSLVNTQYSDDAVSISAVNSNDFHPNEAIIFDSSNPTGGDTDLGTPNILYGGPGIGLGGILTNDRNLGKVLIIAEDIVDNDSNDLVDDPDDEAAGGKIVFTFSEGVKIQSLDILDVDNNSWNVKSYDEANSEIITQNIANLGDNSLQNIGINQTEFQTKRLEITMTDSGAIDNLSYCRQ